MVSDTICPLLCGNKPAFKTLKATQTGQLLLLLVQQTSNFLPTSDPDEKYDRGSKKCGLRIQRYCFPPCLSVRDYGLLLCGYRDFSQFAPRCGTKCGFGTADILGRLVLKQDSCSAKEILTTRANWIAKTCRSTIFNNLEIDCDSVHFYALFILVLASPRTCKVRLEQELTGSKSQACSLEPLNHTTDFISGRSN